MKKTYLFATVFASAMLATACAPEAPAHEHTFGEWVAGELSHSKTCECGEIVTENHAWNDGEVTKPATHTEKGEKTFTCTVCGATKKEDINEDPTHVFGAFVDDENGTTHTKTCACGDTITENHSWNNGEVTKPATHTEKGETTFTCTVCGATKKEDINEDPTHVYGPFIDDENGTTHTKTCACGDTVTENHVAGDPVIADSSEIDGNIDILSTCSVCDGTIEVLNTTAKKVAATFHFDTTARTESSQFTYDADTHVYSSNNKGVGNSSSYLDIVIDSDGVIAFDYTCSGEKGYDYMFFGPSTTENQSYVNCKNAAETQAHYEKDVVAGEKLVFVFKKDSSGNQGDDCATVKFVESNFVYNILQYDTNGGNAIAPTFILNGKLSENLPTPTIDDKYFGGWFVDDTFTTEVTAETGFDGDATIVAKWIDPISVTLNANGGVCDSSVSFKPGTTPEIPTPTREGFTFQGWFTDEQLTQPYVDGDATEGFSLYAKWFDNANKHALTGSYHGAKVYVSGNSWTATSSYPEIDIAVDGAYSIRTGWSMYLTGTLGAHDPSTGILVTSDDDVGNIIDIGNGWIVVAEKATLGTSSSNSYVHIVKKDGTDSTTGFTCKTINNKNIAFVEFPYDGDTKAIIMIDVASNTITPHVSLEDANGEPVAIGSVGSTMNVIVKKDESTIKSFYFTSSNTYATEATTAAGTFIDGEKTITFSGAGKALCSLSGTTSLDVTELSANTYYVKGASIYRWVVTVNPADHTCTIADRTVSVTLDLNYEGAPAGKVLTWGYEKWESIPSNEVPTRANFAFDGWYTAADGGDKITGTKSLTADTTFYAHWISAINVCIHTNDGNDPTTQAFPENSTPSITAPSVAEKMFAGWFTDEALTTPWDGNVTTTLTDIYAKFIDTPFFVGKFFGYNSDNDGTKLYGEATKSSYDSSSLVFTDTGTVSGKWTTTWSAVDFNETEKTLVLGNGSKVSFVEADDGTVFAFYDYHEGKDYCCDDDFMIGIMTETSPTILDKTLCWLNGYQKIIKLTVNGNVYMVYIDGYNQTTNPSGGKAYVDVTFKNASDEVMTFDDLACADPVSFASEIKIFKGQTLVGLCGGDGTTLNKNDMKSGTYTGTIDGVASSVVLNGYGVASVTVGENEAVNGTYVFTSESEVKVTFGTKVVSFTVTGNALTQILDGFEGVWTAPEDTTITLTGYGVASVTVGQNEAVQATYTVSGNKLFVTIDQDVKGYVMDTVGKTLEALPAYEVTNAGSSSSYHWVYDSSSTTWTSNNKGINSSYCTMTISANEATTVVVTYWASSESDYRWDYFHINKNGTELYHAGGSSMTDADAVTQTIELAPGDVLILKYEKDGSTNGGQDKACITQLTINGVQYEG